MHSYKNSHAFAHSFHANAFSHGLLGPINHLTMIPVSDLHSKLLMEWAIWFIQIREGGKQNGGQHIWIENSHT